MVLIGSRILEYRKKLNMSQEEFANKIGVSRQAVSKWELDKAYPDLDKLVDICEMFGLSLDELVNGVEQDEKSVIGDERNAEMSDVVVKMPGIDGSQTGTDNQTENDNQTRTDHQTATDSQTGIDNQTGIDSQTRTDSQTGIDSQTRTDSQTRNDHQTATDSQPATDNHKVKIGRRKGLCVVMYAAAALSVFCIVVSFVIMFQNAWKHGDNVMIHVDKVHAQYTLADVSYLNDDLDDKHRLMWIDVKGIRAGDTLPGYVDDAGELANVDHETSTLVIPCVLALVFLAMFILLRIELTKTHQMDIERAISDIQERA